MKLSCENPPILLIAVLFGSLQALLFPYRSLNARLNIHLMMPTQVCDLSRLFQIPEKQLKCSVDQFFASVFLGLEFFFAMILSTVL